jgi:glycosyltransferase involved in cell wall biosynthesis
MNVISKVEAVPRVSTAAAGRYVGTQLPLISFIVVNYNYGRFLRQCVESIFAQTYPVIECIVVDNKSTDESSQVIADLKATYPQLDVIYEPANLGQSAACVDGYKKSSGHFVVFVDADDYYFETFAETHFLVHLALPQAVGFTSSDMIQVVDNSIVLGNVLTAALAASRSQFYDIDIDASRIPTEIRDATGLGSTIGLQNLSMRFIVRSATEWLWAPTSGNMYRRDALALFIDARTLPSLRYATDAFFNYGINAFTGSVVIDKSLAAYRIHGGNLFAKHASLHHICNYLQVIDESPKAAKLALMHVVAHAEHFAEKSIYLSSFISAIYNIWRKASQSHGQHALTQTLKSFGVRIIKLYWQIKLRLA